MSTSTSSSRSPAVPSPRLHTPESSSPGSAQHGHHSQDDKNPNDNHEWQEEDEHGLDIGEEELLSSDPLTQAIPPAAAQQSPSFASRFLPAPFKRRATSSPHHSDSNNGTNAPNTTSRTHPTPADWTVPDPARRVAYADLTAIDWIHEYGKERARISALTSTSSGLRGQTRLAWDASQVWIVLVLTGIAVGGIAAFIDVVSDWLGDLKGGVCAGTRAGGRWWLNRGFCCWGVEGTGEGCEDWKSWGALVGFEGGVGAWVVEYVGFVVLSVGFATAASGLVNRYALYAKQSGIPEIKTVLGGFVIRRFMGGWVLVVKSLGLCLAVASGMWLGKEGPLVHVACCCANLFMKPFDGIAGNEARKRETLSAAAASGISVAFGAPIGGVLFSLEQLSYYFPDKTMWASFVCAMIAAVTLQAFDPFRTGELVLYQVTFHSGWHAFELVPFAVIGVLGGLYGAMFIKLNMFIARWRARRTFLAMHPVVEVAVVALATSLISYPITFLRAQSSELVEYLFAECMDLTSDSLNLCRSGVANTGVIFILLISSLLGFFLATLTFGLQIPAGILLPSMAIGALYGRAIGLIIEVWQREHPTSLLFATCEPDVPCVTPGTYAVIGAAATLAGATRMTVSIVVIMFELTGALTDVLPIMIAVMISKWVGDAFGTRGIYESWIHFAGYPYLENKDEPAAIPDIEVSRLMTRYEDLVCLPTTATTHTIASLQQLLHSYPYRGYPVITSPSNPVLLGYISHPSLSHALSAATTRGLAPSTPCSFLPPTTTTTTTTTPNLDLRSWMDQTPITLSQRSSLQMCNALFQKLGLKIVFLTAKGGVLAGLMSKKDLWGVFDEEDHSGKRGEGEVGGGRLREEREGREEEGGLLGSEERGRVEQSR